MKLIHIDRSGCYHMSEIMPAISTIYQMEQEFFPYLTVNFKPNDGKEPGIILQTATGDIRKAMTFDSPQDVRDLRKFLWEQLKNNYNITDITDEGCVPDLRKMGRQNVVQGWRPARQARCSNCFNSPISMPEKDQLKGIKHQVYNLNPQNKLNKESCIQLRNIDCDHNYPIASDQNRVCRLETNYYCNNRYPSTNTIKKESIETFVPNSSNLQPNIFLLTMVLIILYVGFDKYYKR